MSREGRNDRAYRRARAAVIAASHRAPGGGTCGICLRPLGSGPRQADHILRVRDGGGDEPANLRAVHPACNYERERELELPRARIAVRA